MASKKASYKSVAVTTVIRATSRASVKVGESYYTLEYSEERLIPEMEGVDLNKEREFLWETVNTECDHQIEDILKSYKK